MANLSNEAINELRHQARNVVRELGLLNDAYFEIGVTLAERHLLIELSGVSSPTMGDIAERLLLDKSTVSRLIAKAVKKGYIECIKDDKDQRKRLLRMTEVGRQTLQAFEPIAFNQTKQALLTLTDVEVEQVYKGVALYAKGLRNSRTKLKVEEEKKWSCDNESLAQILNDLNKLGYKLRLFDPQDEDGLYQIYNEVVESGSQFPYECSSIQEFHRHFFNEHTQVYVCQTEKGEIVGGFYLKANYSGRSSHIANAAYMIASKYRGKGIGTLLIRASLCFAKNLGFKAMQFNMVLSQNALAVKLYQKLGFHIAGTIPEAVRNPDETFQDGYVMFRKL